MVENYMVVSDDAGNIFIIDYDTDAEMVFTLIETFEELVDAEEYLRLLETDEYNL